MVTVNEIFNLGKHLKDCPHCNINSEITINYFREYYKGRRIFPRLDRQAIEFAILTNDLSTCVFLDELEQSIFIQTANTFYLDVIIANKSIEEYLNDIHKINKLLEALG